MTHGTAKDIAEVVSAAGELVGRTRLQKTVAILEIAGVGYGFPFEYYKFGPYSEDLVTSADRAVALGYVSEEERRAGWGGRYSVYRTDEKQTTGNSARDAMIEIARSADAVALELAVTAAFLAHTGTQDAWREVAHRKPEKVGGSHLTDAKALYAKFKQVAEVGENLPQI